MTLPSGIVPKTVTIGTASFFDGTIANGTATVTAPVNVIHTPTNSPIFSSAMVRPFVNGSATFVLCPTDASGLNRHDWTYELTVSINGALVQPDPIYFTLSSAGPDILDLDSLVTVPSSAGTPVSVSVPTLSGPNTWTGTQDFTGATVTGIAGSTGGTTGGTTGLATVATTGSYTDLTNKPTIPTVGAAGAGAAVALSSTDASVTNARTPTAHAASHAAAGGDPLTLAASQVTGLGSASTQPSSAFDASGAASSAQAFAVQRANHTGTQSADTLTDGTTNKAFLATERTKLTGVATGATANSPDATLLARANHTGTQAATTITGLATVATSGSYTDLSGKPTIPATQTVQATVSASGALVVNSHNPVDATGGTKTMTLPTGQTQGTVISVEKEDASTNTVAVTGNIRGVGSSSLSLVWQYESVTFITDSAGSWWPRAGHKTKASLDSAYALPTQTSNGGKFLTTDGSVATWGTPGAATAASAGWYGDGSDGDVTISTSVTFTRDMHYRNLTVASGGSVKCDSYRLFVSGTCTVQAGGVVHNDGGNAIANAGGSAAGGNQRSLGRGLSGASNGTATAGTSTTITTTFQSNSLGGSAGAGGTTSSGAGGAGGAVTGASWTASTNPNSVWRSLPVRISGYAWDQVNDAVGNAAVISGGGGGGSGAGNGVSTSNGGGGGGAGVLVLAARFLSIAGRVSANGGNGGQSAQVGGGGGGGGGGGVVLITCETYANTGTLTVDGGAGGPINGTAGTAGVSGNAGTISVLVLGS